MQPSPIPPAGSTPTSAARTAGEAPGRAREVAAQFEGLLVRAVFAPLSTSLGWYGDAVVDAAARTIAAGERGGLTDALERAIAERDP